MYAPQQPITVTQIVSFILRHRGESNAFLNYTPEDLYSTVCDGINDACVVVDSDDIGGIKGVIVASVDRSSNVLHIIGILCLSSNSMARFAGWLRRQRDKDGFNITAMRRGKEVVYDSQRLLDKLISRYGRN
jgi:hypothetical protein